MFKSNTKRRVSHAADCVVETLEQRRLLTASVRALIPALYTGPAPQTPLGNTITELQKPGNVLASASYYRFATDDAADGATTSVHIGRTLNVDAAIALFDATGNLLRIADADAAPGSLGSERLDVTLVPKTPYILGVYSLASLNPVEIAISLPQQAANTSLKLDAATGATSFAANTGEDTFNSPADPDYFPLDFFNGRDGGAVQVSGIGGVVPTYVGVLREAAQATVLANVLPGDKAWRLVGEASGIAPIVNVAPEMDRNLADTPHMVSVAPLDFTSPARAYRIDAAASTLEAASIENEPVMPLGTPLPTTLGTATILRSDIIIPAQYYSFVAAQSGTIELTVSASTGTTLALYDESGATLLAARGRTTATSYSFTHPVTAGTTYRLALSTVAAPSASATLTIRQTYTPEAISVETNPAIRPNLTLGGTAGAAYYRITMPKDVDVLSMRVSRNDALGGTITSRVIGGNIATPITRTAAAGNNLNVILDARTYGRQVDVAVTADNAASFDLAVAAVKVPRIAPASLTAGAIDLDTGDLSQSAGLGPVNSIGGVQFWAINTGAQSTITVTGDADAYALLAHYEEQDGALRLVDFNLPSPAGLAQRVATIGGGRMAAVAAVSARPDGAGGSVQINIDGQRPIGVGIATAPEPVPPQTNPPFSTNLRVRNIGVRSTRQRDLWQTLLPHNMISSPRISIGPAKPGGTLALRVRVLDANNGLLETITTNPGQQISNLSLPSLAPASLNGATLRFLVEPISGEVGDGKYNLQFSADTSNPTPFLVTENSFNFGYIQGTASFPNFEPIQNVAVNSLVQSAFTSSAPYNQSTTGSTGSIDIFRFTHGPTPFAVWTEALTPAVNTNLRLYKGRYSAGDLVALDTVGSPSFDYYPADRSAVDARVEQWNTDLARDYFNGAAYEPGRDTWYVVVKNEGGSQGQYRLHVDDLAAQRSGPGSSAAFFGYGAKDLLINPANGSGAVSGSFANGATIRATMPSTVLGSLTVSLAATNSSGISRTYRLELLDSAGNVLSTQTSVAFNSVNFVVPGLNSLGRYFLRPTIIGGLVSDMTMTSSIPLRTTSDAIKPASHATVTVFNSFTTPSEPYARASQFANGTFVSTKGQLGFTSGLLHKVAFWVDQPGLAQFTLTSSASMNSRVMALWRGVRVGGENNFHIGGVLKDFNSVAQPDGSILLEAAVQPGMYYLTVDGNSPGAIASLSISAQLPLPYSTVVELDPNSGTISLPNLTRVDPLMPTAYPLEDGSLTEFRTAFYKVIAPGGSQAGVLSAASVYTPPPQQTSFPAGRASLTITRMTGATLTYTGTQSIELDGANDTLGAQVNATDLALPGSEYYIGLHRDRITQGNPSLHLTAQFTVPQSGTPDIVVDRVRFAPANGRTLVSVDMRNVGYATVGAHQSKLRFSNYPSDSIFTVLGIGPLAPYTVSFLWDPTNRSGFDTATYTADILNDIEERNEANNSATAALQKVRPVISSMALSDPLMDGDADPNVWGRYVRGVDGAIASIVITPTDADGQADIYRTYFKEAGSFGQQIFTGGGPHTRANFDFSQLQPTSAQNPNRFEAYVQDQWGLTSDVKYTSANVVAKSNFFTSFTFDRAARVYNIAYDRDIVRYDKSISQILGFGVPLIGDKRQKFILHLGARGMASLNPAAAVSLPLGADIELTAFDAELYKKSWTGSTPVSDNFMVGTTLDVSGRYLDVTAAAASFQLRNLNLLSIRTPKIPLFSFGIPKVAAISANFSLGLKAAISAGLKVGLNPAILNDPLNAPLRVGLMSPTFVQPRIEGSAYISGDVEVLGFDIGSLEGRISLGLNVTVGIDNNDPSKVISFDELADRIRFNVTGDLSFGLSASVIIIGEVWSWEPDPITFPLGGNTVEGIITNDPGLPGPFLMRSLAEGRFPVELFTRGGASPPIVRAGSDPVGAYKLNGAPQLLIDPTTGFAISVQVDDADPDPGQTRGQLQFATRADALSPWSALAPIPGAADVANPLLVATRDPAMPYMVVYEAIDLPGPTAAQTFNQRLAARDLRYRTWDGAQWSGEQVLAGDTGSDSAPAVAFAPDGSGVAAWVRNTAAVQMDQAGEYARGTQEIAAAVWDSQSAAWFPGEMLTTDSVVDSQPAAFAEDGRLYVVWIRENGSSNQLVYSTNDGSGWTSPAVLPIIGLPAGGRFTSVALGSESAGQVNVIFNYRVPGADGSLDSRLYNRPTASANFGAPAAVEVIAGGTNFSHVRTTNTPDGSLMVSWKAGDGVTNEIFASMLTAGGGAWSEPMQLTHGTTIEQRPSVAVEPDGSIQVLYEVVEAGEGDRLGAGGPPTVAAVGGTTADALPELGFVGGLEFPDNSTAAAGATSTGGATIINRGLATTDVLIEYLRGPIENPIVLGSRSIRLAPGGTFDAAFDFPIVAGQETYHIRITSADPELVGPADNVASYTLTGGNDIEVVSLSLQNPNLPPGSGNPLQARIRNRGGAAVGAFTVDFRSGDELFPQNPWMSIGSVVVPMLAGGAEAVVSFVPAVPSVSGMYEFSVFANSDGAIEETTAGNNRGTTRIVRLADPGLQTQGFPPTLVSATLLNSSGANNVRIYATLFNFATGAAGSITSGPVTVRLMRSIDDADWVEVDSLSFASVAPGGFGTPIQFITSGLAGDHRYRVAVAPDLPADDSNPFNNVGEARLEIRGLADLSPTNVSIDQSTVPQGGAAVVTVAVANLGIADATDLLVEVIGRTSTESGAVVLASVRVDRIAALTASTLEIPLNTSIPAGVYELIVVVNRTGEILEMTDLNNASSPLQLAVTAAGPATLFSDYAFDDQPRPGFVIAFTEPVQGLDVNDLELLHLTTGVLIPTADLVLELSPDSTTATLRYTGSFNGALPDGGYRMSIAAGAFADLDGNPNAAVEEEFFVLAGDANRDQTIGIGDFAILASRFNLPGTFSQGDFNYDGTTNIADFAILASKFNTGLPRPAAPQAPFAAGRTPFMAPPTPNVPEWSALRDDAEFSVLPD